MTILSRLMGQMGQLPPAETYDLVVRRNVRVPMPDGVVLLADHYYPRGNRQVPTILVRSPYGRAGLFGLLFARLFAERGFQVLIQSCRGTFGSGGVFDAFRNERADGLATVAWLKRQPWFAGTFATVGPSYLGLTQWAIADGAGPELKAMVPQITTSDFRTMSYYGKSFGLDTALTWLQLMARQEDEFFTSLQTQRQAARQLRSAFRHLPLDEVDTQITGRPVAYYQDWLVHNTPEDPWWDSLDFSAAVAKVTAPMHLLGGWYDIFLPGQLADYARLRQANRQPYLTIGPWAHTSLPMFPFMIRDAIIWFRAHLLGDRSRLRKAPVRIFLMGANKWKNFAAWPPPGYRPQRWHLQPGGGLAATSPTPSAPDRYRYDPADPTPAVGGSSLSNNSGPKDNRALEARRDVLVYTSPPLDRAVEAIGPVSAELYVTSSREHTDFYVRLCDVNPAGKSRNVCDGLVRLQPGQPPTEDDGCRRVVIDLWPTAHRFQPGHRLRVQVASGAHPRWVRNLGSGEPLATATTLHVADQAVYHDPDHPSAIILPVLA